jgi:hypothetical protein
MLAGTGLRPETDKTIAAAGNLIAPILADLPRLNGGKILFQA